MYGPSEGHLIDTWSYTKEKFASEITSITQKSNTICFYICLHGKQFKNAKTGEPEEFLKINDQNLIKDTDFSELINSIKFNNLYMFLEVCHGGGLINTIKLDDTICNMANVNVVIFNVCSKEKKCYMLTDKVSTIGTAASTLVRNRVNPFKAPAIGLQLIKKFYTDLQPKVTIINTIS